MSDLHEGDVIGPLTVPAVKPENMKLMAAILRDPNPIHFDRESVSKLGLGDRRINQGPATLSYAANLLVRDAGGVPAIRSLRFRLSANVLEGDQVDVSGTVTSVDARSATIALEARRGEDVVVSGEAVVDRPPAG